MECSHVCVKAANVIAKVQRVFPHAVGVPQDISSPHSDSCVDCTVTCRRDCQFLTWNRGIHGTTEWRSDGASSVHDITLGVGVV